MELVATYQGQEMAVKVRQIDEHHFEILIDDRKLQLDLREVAKDGFSLIANHQSFDVHVSKPTKRPKYEVLFKHESFELALEDPLERALAAATGGKAGGGATLEAAMPGLIQRLLVMEGDEVSEDQGLLVLVAMKMENELGSPASGKVKKIHVKPGDNVESGTPLVEIG